MIHALNVFCNFCLGICIVFSPQMLVTWVKGIIESKAWYGKVWCGFLALFEACCLYWLILAVTTWVHYAN